MAKRSSGSDPNPAMENLVKDTLLGFQTQLNAMLTQMTDTMEDLKRSAALNSNQLRSEYTKGAADLQQQLKKANEDMISGYTRNYNELKNTLRDNYDNVFAQAKTNIEKNLSSLRTTVPTILQKITGPHQKVFEDMVKIMEANGQKTLNNMSSSYKEMMANLESNYQETLANLKAGAIASEGQRKNSFGEAGSSKGGRGSIPSEGQRKNSTGLLYVGTAPIAPPPAPAARPAPATHAKTAKKKGAVER